MLDLDGEANEDDVLYQQLPSSSLSRIPHVDYSCGSCGYELNLNSCNRNASITGSQYAKSIKRRTISFYSVDESKFIQIDQLRCKPYLTSKRSWGLFRRRTKLLCGKCRKLIGVSYNENGKSPGSSLRSYDSTPWDGMSGNTTYDIKITSLQPSKLFEKSASASFV
ncbi:hypothetical protein AgCh_013715 [Apium graveolens]